MLGTVLAAQVALALIAARMVFVKLREIAWTHRVDSGVLLGEARAALADDDLARLQELSAAAAPSYLGSVLEAGVDALEGGGDPGAFLYTAALEARHRAIHGVKLIRGMASLAGAGGLLGAMAHHFYLMYGDHGLRGLHRAALEPEATRGALLSMALGMATAIFLFASSRVIRREVVARVSEVAQAAELLEEAFGREKNAPAEPT